MRTAYFLTCLCNILPFSFLIILPLSMSSPLSPLFSSSCAVARGASSKALMAVSQRTLILGAAE